MKMITIYYSFNMLIISDYVKCFYAFIVLLMRKLVENFLI